MNLEGIATTVAALPPPAAPPTTSPALGLCVFGRDERGRQRASAFSSDDAPAAERAAALMGLSTLVVTEKHAALARSLTAGRIFQKSGKAFVPFCAKGIHERLLAAAGLPDTPMPVRAAGKPAEPPPAPAGGKGGDGAAGGAGGADDGPKSPTAWSEIGRGSLVLACAGPMEGWFEAVVMYTKLSGEVQLRWRDWPDDPLITRKRGDLGLLPPDSTEGWR